MKIYPTAPAVIVDMRNRCQSCPRGLIGCGRPKSPTPPPCRVVKDYEVVNQQEIDDWADQYVPPTTEYVNAGRKQENTWNWYPFGIGFCAGTLVWSFILILSKGGL